jgi:phosphoglycerol transferase
MTRLSSWRDARFIVAAACAVVLVFLLQRSLGLNPAVFVDEWYYSKMSRLTELKDAVVPSYLYLWVFRASRACGTGFLDCVRVGNVLFFVGAAPFVYATARTITTPRIAALVAVFALFAPLNLYTAFFMPESMYYFGFCVLGWIALTGARWGQALQAAAAGAVLGLMSLVKVHALFLLPALCLYLLGAGWTERAQRPWLRNGVLAMATAAAVAVALKFAIGYLLAGKAGLSLFGSFYGASASSSSSRPLAQMLGPAFVNLRGHLMALAVLLGLPLAMLAHSLLSPAARRAAGPAAFRLHLYALLMLGAALGLTVLYTASISSPANQEAVRLHLRYYNFVFPLLFMVAAAPLAGASAPASPLLRRVLVLLLVIVLAVALVKLPTYALSTVDGPDISEMQLQKGAPRLLLVLELAALVLWAANSTLAPRLFLFAALPASLLLAQSGERFYLRQLLPSSDFPADAAGKYARATIPEAERKLTTIVGTGLPELYRAQFHLDDKDASLLDLPQGAPIASYQLPAHNKWLVVVGPHALPQGVEPAVTRGAFALVRLAPHGHTIAQAEIGGALPNGMVAGAEGLSTPEGWGRWSDGARVVVHFDRPLPRKGTLVLTALAFGPNTGLPFTLRVGSSATRFRLGAPPQEVALPFDTDGSARSLEIEVPQPTAPSALGGSGDNRKLGIGLAKIEVVSDDGPALSER